ncbi:MAG: pentapeptide repeat-containing protein [Gammaproteobacteria bacterium]|nr:pentapeptide repeat-containing protein [Gammaproteobacteria bacterium]
MSRPRKLAHPLYQLLIEEHIDSFNSQKAQFLTSAPINLQGADLRGLNLRGLDAKGLDLRDAYLRSCDLRGIDFRDALLEGASLNRAKISGCYFAHNLSAEEIIMSLTAGTRLRCDIK